MSKILLIGDLHTKTFLLPLIDEVVEEVEPDRIVLMGDIFDDWGMSGAESLKAAKGIFSWLRGYENAVVLFGNHDMAYFSMSGKCAGNNRSIMSEAHGLLENNIDIIRAAEVAGSWLFTHGGLCHTWAVDTFGGADTPQEAARYINLLLGEDGHNDLEAAGRARGGWKDPGPLWADWSELLLDHYPNFNQIVGHSPMMTCTYKRMLTGEHLWGCDTFSASSSGFPHGDGSMLLLDTKTDDVTVAKHGDSIEFDAAYAKHYGYGK